MATVCASSLSLMQAGVPVKKPVAGIAMGLITDEKRFAVLSDILGDEDHLGDMDFKVAGTKDGITGFQMDIKISSVSTEILAKALEQARRGRLHILGIMENTIAVPAGDISEYAPKVVTARVDQEKIGAVIGPAGKNIKGMCEKFDVQINVDEEGNVTIYGKNQKAAVKNGWFFGSVTQDPYMIGYLSVELAVKAINGETIEPIVDTGCQFYTAANMDDAKIAPLLYD
jgi:polyribonucleotide nucleotidyltransferase